MDSTADGPRPAAVPESSAGDLVKLLSEQVTVLVRDELKLAQLEMQRKGKQAGLGIGMLGGGGLIGLYAAACLLACAVIAISGVVAAWLAALIVGAALLAAAGALALLGKGRLRRAVPPVPQEALNSVKTDVEVAREGARHEH
jgi:hypothetical protein